jgi:hypothetical protein
VAFLARVKMIIAIFQESDIEGQKAHLLGDNTRHDNSLPKIRWVRPVRPFFFRLALISVRPPPALFVPSSRGGESRRRGNRSIVPQPMLDVASANLDQFFKRYMTHSGVS